MTRRLVVSYLLVAAFVLVVVELPLGLTFAGRAQDRLLADVERDARVLAGLVEERVERDDAAAVSSIAVDYAAPIDGRVVITDAEGRSLVDTSSPDGPVRDFSTRPEFVAALDGTQAAGIRRSETLDEELAYVAVPISSDGVVTGVVRVSFPTHELREQIRENWMRLGLLTVLVLAAAGSVGWLIARWAVAPIASLEDGASRIAEGDLGGRAVVGRGPPELRHLAETFNEMAVRLEALIGSQRAFVADASHQLRTPLTALRLRIESLEQELDDPPDREGSLGAAREDAAAIGAEIDRLSRLVEGLLALARSETSVGTEVVDVVEVVDDAVARWGPLALEHDVELLVVPAAGPTSPRALPARVARGGLPQILDNLIDNALEVAPPGTTVELSARSDDDDVELTVRDHGPGMTVAERARAADRFWRGAGAGPGGTGLGLAIVAELAAATGGTVGFVEPDDGDGLVVRVRLPRPT